MPSFFTALKGRSTASGTRTHDMAAPDFTFRNLTGIKLVLEKLERFKAPTEEKRGLDSVFDLGKNLTNLAFNQTSTPSGQELAENAQSFFSQDINIPLETFTIRKTDLQPPVRIENEIVRFTFIADDQKFRFDCPTAKHLAASLHPLVPNPKFNFTGVFLAKESFVTLFSSADLDKWMGYLDDVTPLSALSLPGTHNSPTCHNALPSVRCQAVSPRSQLDNGVRFFDIRVQPENPPQDPLVLVHGVFPISLTGSKQFRDLEKSIVEFLDKNPSETVVVSLKREGTGGATDSQLAQILLDHYTHERAPRGTRWYTLPAIPSLGQARGKIVLLRRFGLDDRQRQLNDGKGFGINASSWADNTPHDLQESICVQDFYEVLETENVDKKIKFATDQSERAGDVVASLPGITTDATHPVPTQPFYINFLSASNFWKVGCWPEKIAAKLNPAIIEHLCIKHHVEGERERPGDGGTGIVVCDWVGGDGDWDLVRCIVGCNARLRARELSLKEH